MFYLRYEYLSESFPRSNVFKIRGSCDILNYTVHEDLLNTVKQSFDYPRYEHFFLLDERRFSFFRCEIDQFFEEEITIHTINDLIKKKTIEVR